MRIRGVWLSALLVGGVLAVPSAGSAQAAKVKVQLSQNAVPFPTPGISEFDVGWVESSGIVVTVQPRKKQTNPWQILIRTDDLDMGGYGKPVGDILWRPAGSTTWTPLTNTNQIVAQGTGQQSVTIYFRLRLDYATDIPGAYSLDLALDAEEI
jgi:hypothetical protein